MMATLTNRNLAAAACFEGKHVVLGVTGSIAAYRVLDLIRHLTAAGANVRVAMTQAATHLLSVQACATLTGHDVWTPDQPGTDTQGMPHIGWARWMDALLIAPCTANTLSHLARGSANEPLGHLALASGTSPVLVAPCMNTHMWQHPATQRNLTLLQDDGVICLPPAVGKQVCGDEGPGRLPDLDTLLLALARALEPEQPLTGRHVVVTAGPILSPLDATRWLINRSSGKMGIALAMQAYLLGADVTVVQDRQANLPSLPLPLQTQRTSGMDGYRDCCEALLASTDLLFATAAVSDFSPASHEPFPTKLTRKAHSLDLEPTQDVVAYLAERSRTFSTGTTLVSFAAIDAQGDPNLLQERGQEKRLRKDVPWVVANDISLPGVGFEHDTNAAVLLSQTAAKTFPTQHKMALARQLLTTLHVHGALEQTA